MNLSLNQNQIITNVQKAVGVVIFVSVIELLLIVFSFGSRAVYESISSDYHLASIELLSQISEEMSVIQYELVIHIPRHDTSEPLVMNPRELVRSVYLIKRHNELLQSIEQEPDHNQYPTQTKLLNDELSKLFTILDIKVTPDNVRALIKVQNIINLKLKVEQLKLLHRNTNDRLIEQIQELDERNIIMIIIVALMMLLLSVYIIRRSLKIIKQGLEIQNQYQEQLAKEKNELYKQEAENREILSSVIEGIITINQNGKIVTFNRAAENMFGYKKNDAIGLNVSILMTDDEAQKHDDHIQKYVNTGLKKIIGIPRELVAKHREGHSFPVRLNVSELPSASGDNKRFIASIQDLSEIKSQEEQIRRSQKMDALGKLTGGIAHDYNNMLAVISGYASLLADQVDDEHLKKYATEISKAGDRGAKLTRKLLSFSKRTAASEELCNISDVLNHMSDMLQKTMTARIQLTFNLEEDLPKTRVNSADLEDAVLNICINSMHAIDWNGNVEIHTTQARLNAKDYVELRIIDDGCGMNETMLDKIFDPFYSTKGEKGTGLGLSQVYSFIERSRGKIEIDSKPGVGTQVIMRFPVISAADSADEIGEIVTEDIDNLHGSVLVVDDEEQILDYLKIILEDAGLTVRTANNGKAALEELAKEACDLVLSDIIMPEMNGIQLAKEVKLLYPDIKVQLATGYTSDIEIEELEEKLAKTLLTKPYNAKEILNRVSYLLS